MKLNQAGIDLIKRFEGCKLKAYPDIGTNGEPYTIGFGHTGSDVRKDSWWTQAQADDALRQDLDNIVKLITNYIKPTLSDNEFSALVSFAYNLGPSTLKNSTLLKLINQGDIILAADEFPKWDKAGGKPLKGLLERRLAEQALFNT